MKFLICSFSGNHCNFTMVRIDVFRTLVEQPGTLTVLSDSFDKSIDTVGSVWGGVGGGRLYCK